jgi:high-affinity Fe2+/Pb2+ permease
LEYIAVAGLAVFVATLFLMIKRPRGIRLGYAVGVGAVASLVLWAELAWFGFKLF